jgi:hypothetical protein
MTQFSVGELITQSDPGMLRHIRNARTRNEREVGREEQFEPRRPAERQSDEQRALDNEPTEREPDIGKISEEPIGEEDIPGMGSGA